MEESHLLTLFGSVCPSYTIQSHPWGVESPHFHINHKPRKCPTGLPSGQSDGIFEVPSLQMSLLVSC